VAFTTISCEANLFDMTAKYPDPLTAEEVVVHLSGSPTTRR
jgi:hypothetical protein